jgi:hypothetical protein
VQRNFLIILFFLSTFTTFAQVEFVDIHTKSRIFENEIYINQTNKHTSIYPMILKTELDSLYEFLNISTKSKFADTFLNKDLISAGKNFKVSINPILTSEYFKNFGETGDILQSQIGLNANLNFKDKLFSKINFSNHANTYANYVSARIDSTQIIPHFGREYSKSGNLYSFLDLNGYLAYNASKYINFQIGKDRNFLGEGYRSLFLSDNAQSLSFIKTTVEIWKIKYLVMYNMHKDVNTSSGNLNLNKKYSVIHYLSWNIGKRFTANMFETVIWRGQDSTGYRGYDVNYLNPIIFFRPVDFSIGSPDNVIMGIGGKIKLFKSTYLYSQFIADEFKIDEIKAGKGWWANKFGIQAGMKCYNLFTIKNLFFLGEINAVRPFTFSHESSMENYGNYHQSMNHPLGANYSEAISIIEYSKNRFSVSAKIILSKYGTDDDSLNYGQNIYRSYYDTKMEYGNKLFQGIPNSAIIGEGKIQYLINPKWNLKFEAGIRYRKQSTATISKTDNYIFIGLKTNLFNSDVDY